MPTPADPRAVAQRFGLKIEAVGNGEYKACCPIHQENTPSFRLYPDHLHCFGCGWHGDALDLARELERLSMKDAKAALGVASSEPRIDPYAGIKPAGTPDYPPHPGRDVTVWNPKFRDSGRPKGWSKYRPDRVHVYRSATGAILGVVLRVPIIGDRKITPWIEWSTWLTEPGKEASRRDRPGWCHTKPARPRPLYGLDLLARRPNAGVILVEGEKCADWLRKFGFLAIAWPGGGNAAVHADWSPLAGRRVLAWPDADAPGLQAMTRAGELVTAAGAASFRMLTPEPDRPKGWDCADAVGWSRQDFVRWMQQRVAPAAGETSRDVAA
jgi:hypothetical protein